MIADLVMVTAAIATVLLIDWSTYREARPLPRWIAIGLLTISGALWVVQWNFPSFPRLAVVLSDTLSIFGPHIVK